ncbi:MAG TPA: NAD-dependent epimerase/dehydratase family protein [Nevskiaceae bacterium]|nr:NAD-dependent epimerase/dehydratase family protein [Nevskiaceae bacterium]
MAKCLVLGGNGFIGSHLVDSLIEAGHSVRAFDRYGDRPAKFLAHTNVETYKGDFLNRADLSNALQNMDYVFHFISTTTPITAENDPLIDIETNIKMSIQLFEECVNHKIKKVIFASTGGAIYGASSVGKPLAETVLPLPFSPYAIGKLTIEHYLRYFNKKFGLNSLTFRISNPYGERQSLLSKQGVIPIFLQHIAGNEPITVLGDGSMVRDYIYVKDVARLITASFEQAREQLYNLGSGRGETVNELIQAMEAVVDRPIRRNQQEVPVTFVDKVVLDIGLYTSEFGDQPMTSLEEGIRKTWEYVLASQQEPK